MVRPTNPICFMIYMSTGASHFHQLAHFLFEYKMTGAHSYGPQSSKVPYKQTASENELPIHQHVKRGI